jgi:hypothetical protein
MPSKKHGELIEKFISGQTKRVLRIDSRIHPDLVLISPEGHITAVEIELSHEGIAEVKKRLEEYSEYDNVLVITSKRKKPYSYVFKAKRYLPKKIFDRIKELSSGHQFGKHDHSIPKMQKQLENEFGLKIPLSTISMIRSGRRKWTEIRNPPEFETITIQLK